MKESLSSREWVERNIHKGREWVSDNYQLHCKEVKDPVSTESFSRYVRHFASKYGKNEIDLETPEVDYEQQDDKVSYVVRSSDIRTLDQLLDYCRVDTTIWRVKRHRVNSWGSESNPSFQVRAELERRKTESDEDVKQNFIKDALSYKPKNHLKFNRPKNKDGYLLEISLPDPHFGLLAWGKETLGVNYNIKIAEKIFMSTLSSIMSDVKSYKIPISKILFIIGNDFFNVDSHRNLTTAGTPQDEDSRWQKSFTAGRRVVVNAVDSLLQFADVDIMIVPGNHDMERSFYLGESLYAWYHDSNHVNVDNDPSPRKYYSYGNSLIGFDHGTKGGIGRKSLNELPLIMATEAPGDLWSKSKYIEMHTAHIHKEGMIESRGIKVLSIPSIVPSSAWEMASGFKHLKEAQCHVWSKDRGKKMIIIHHPFDEEYDDE